MKRCINVMQSDEKYIAQLDPDQKEILVTLLGRLMRCAAAPYHENLVSTEVLKIVEEFELYSETDDFGTIWVGPNLGQGSGSGSESKSDFSDMDSPLEQETEVLSQEAPPSRLIMAAHMDHPGFEVLDLNEDTGLWRCQFLGGVGKEYFKEWTPLTLYPSGVRGWLRGPATEEKQYWVEAPEAVRGEVEFAVWDLEAFRLEGDQVFGRACDDLVGVAVALTCLIVARQSFLKAPVDQRPKSPVPLVAMLSRAEEVGFQGALASMDRLLNWPHPWVVSLEASREIPGVHLGEGVILRVGDRSSVFDSGATAFLRSRAEILEKQTRNFIFQMAWMGGGSCEGTAFQARGLRTGALCVPLLNYHNQGDSGVVEPEGIHLLDGFTMVELLLQAAWDLSDFNQPQAQLNDRLEGLRSTAIQRLKKTS